MVPDFNPKWLLALGVGAAVMLAVNGVMPGAGVILAASVAFWWLIQSGGITFLVGVVNRINKAAA